jgi:DnaJ-class molecular chaperone
MEDLGSMFEAFFGAGRGAEFGGMGGMGGAARGGRGRRAKPTTTAPPPPAAVEHEIEVAFMAAAKGGAQQLRIQQESGRTRTIEVKIPRGTADGARMRVRGGAEGADIILRVRVQPHPIFRRSEHGPGAQGLDLYLDLPLTIAEAALGTTVSVPTLDGAMEMKVPPGTASGRKLRVRGKGIEDESGKRGDLYAIIQIIPPSGTDLSAEEAAALRSIAAKGPSPRADWKT